MKRTLWIAVAALCFASCEHEGAESTKRENAWKDGHLYIAEFDASVEQTIEGDHLVSRVPVTKVPITDAVLRRDTKDSSILWLELHMEQYRDPGDLIYHFAPARKRGQFYVRGSDIHADGCKWAMLFEELSSGREALRMTAAAYRLTPKRALDQTEG